MSRGKIFLLKDGGLSAMAERSYDAESVLQRYLADHPSLLAGEQIDRETPRSWILIDREIGVPDADSSAGRWSLDHLFIDQFGVPTLVEVKRSENTDARRKVVGQMLDYAANATRYWHVDEVRATYEASVDDPEAELRGFLGEDRSVEEYWSDVESNIETGRIRMLFVADEIPPELVAIVEFLNQQMDPAEVLAVEVPQYSGDGRVALVPRIRGQTQAARRKRGTSSRKQWTEESFEEDVGEKLEAAEREAALNLYRFAREAASGISFGTGSKNASFSAIWEEFHPTYGLFTVRTTGDIEFTQIKWISNDPELVDWDLSTLEVLASGLSEIDGVDVSRTDLEEYVSLPVAVVREEDELEKFETAIAEFVASCAG